MKWEDKIEFAALSDVGMRRSNNQDSYAAVPAPTIEQWRARGHVFLVADGMGAHAVGELASKIAADSIPHTYDKLRSLPPGDALAKAVQDANTTIHNRGKANRDFQGMGTTSTVLVLGPDGALIGHVGDSRAYRIRNNTLGQLSFDHSLAWELVRRRQLTPKQAKGLVPANVITRSLGPEAEVQVDVEGPHVVQPGDVFVLCSDGLSGQVSDAEVGVLARYLPPRDACQYLVDLANLHGGPDNVTVIVVRVGNPAGESAAADRTDAPPAARRFQNYPLLCLLLGLLSLLGCLFFWFFDLRGFQVLFPGALGLLLLLAGAIGVVGLRRQKEPPPPPKTTGYREASFQLDAHLLEHFSVRLEQLRDLAVEQAWNIDWSAFYAHMNAAGKFIQAEDNVAALQEFCQALHLMAIAQRSHLEQTRQLLEGT